MILSVEEGRRTNGRSRQQTEVRIIFRKNLDAKRLQVHSQGSPQGRRQVEPLVEFFRKQQPWPGRGKITIIIKNASAVEDASTAPGSVPGYPELRQRAGIKWDVRGFLWSNTEHLHVWKGMALINLHRYIKIIAQSA